MSTHSTTPDSGLVSSTLLEKIDRLFACNAGEYVGLPQLVVVGDQSSGNSSVLEGLTGSPHDYEASPAPGYAASFWSAGFDIPVCYVALHDWCVIVRCEFSLLRVTHS
jgi:hypothetical protein